MTRIAEINPRFGGWMQNCTTSNCRCISHPRYVAVESATAAYLALAGYVDKVTKQDGIIVLWTESQMPDSI